MARWPYDDNEAPDRGTARRRGERDFEEGKGSYEDPYRERAREAFDDYEWRRASRAWEDGYGSARYLAEERQEEERRRQQYEENRRMEEAQLLEDARREEEERMWQELEQQQESDNQPEPSSDEPA